MVIFHSQIASFFMSCNTYFSETYVRNGYQFWSFVLIYTLASFNPLNAELNPICHSLILLEVLTFMGPCTVKYIPIYIQQDATLHSLFISGNCSIRFGWYFHPPSGAHTTVSTASGICHTATAICRYRGSVGTGLSVLWVAYATHSTLRPVLALPR